MRTRRLTLLLWIAAILLALTMSGHAQPLTPSVRADRPRIWVTPESLPALKARAAANGAAWRALKGACDTYINSTSPYDTSIPNYALVYLVTGDTRYSAKAISLMEAKAAQGIPAISYDAGYGVRTVLPAMAFGYDACYGQMTPAQRVRFKTTLEEFADWVWPETNPARRDAWGVRLTGNNYYHGFMSTWLVGLALSGDSDKAAGYIANARNRWFTQVRPYLDRYAAGGYLLEGTNYGSQSLARILRYLAANKTATGEDLLGTRGPWARDALLCKLHLTTPDLKRLYPGGDQSRISSAALGDEDRAGMLELLALAALDADTAGYGKQWLNTINRPALVGKADAWVEFLWSAEGIAPKEYSTTPAGWLASGSGLALSRSDWTEDATFVTFQCGPLKEDHQDRSAGGFLIFRKEWLAACARLTSSSGLHGDTQNFNCMTIGGKGQPRRAFADPLGNLPSLTKHVDTPEYAYFEGDAKDAYTPTGGAPILNSYRRKVLFLKPDRVLVLDDIDAVDPQAVKKWHLNTLSQPTFADGAWTASAGGSTLRCQTLLPAGTTATLTPLALGSGGTTSWRIDVAAPAGQNRDRLLHALWVGPDGAAAPTARLEEPMVGLKMVDWGEKQIVFDDMAMSSKIAYTATGTQQLVLTQWPDEPCTVTIKRDPYPPLYLGRTPNSDGFLTFSTIAGDQVVITRGTVPPPTPPTPPDTTVSELEAIFRQIGELWHRGLDLVEKLKR